MKKTDLNKAIREESSEQLQQRIVELRQRRMQLRFQRVIDTLENHAELKKIRHDIARVETQLTVLRNNRSPV